MQYRKRCSDMATAVSKSDSQKKFFLSVIIYTDNELPIDVRASLDRKHLYVTILLELRSRPILVQLLQIGYQQSTNTTSTTPWCISFAACPHTHSKVSRVVFTWTIADLLERLMVKVTLFVGPMERYLGCLMYICFVPESALETTMSKFALAGNEVTFPGVNHSWG